MGASATGETYKTDAAYLGYERATYIMIDWKARKIPCLTASRSAFAVHFGESDQGETYRKVECSEDDR